MEIKKDKRIRIIKLATLWMEDQTVIEQIFEHIDDLKTTWNWLFNPTMTFGGFSLEKYS